MTTWLVQSTDTGAPVSTGVAGSHITLLDALFVNGFNSSSSGWSAAYAAGVITYTKTAHGMPLGAYGVVITVTGFSPSGYNVTRKTCTVVDANTLTVSGMADPGGAATGTATVKRADIGATKAFAGTNLASYQWPAGTQQRYLAIDDTGTTQIRIRGFETMTAAGPAVANGTGPVPTDAQNSGGLYAWKSNTADATARPWVFVYNSNTGIASFFVQHTSVAGVGGGWRFGDCYSRKPGDVWATLMQADSIASSSSIKIWAHTGSYGSGVAGVFMFRNASQAGGAQNDCITSHFGNGSSSELGALGVTYPDPITGGMLIVPVLVCEGTTIGIRAAVPGLYHPGHARPFNHGDYVQGLAGTPYAGKTFLGLQGGSSACCLIEVSDTYTNPL